MEDSNVLVGLGWDCRREVLSSLGYLVLNALGFGRLNILERRYLEEMSLGIVKVVTLLIRLVAGFHDGVLQSNHSPISVTGSEIIER